MDLGWGVYFDLTLLALVALAYVSYRVWRWLTYDRYERQHRRQIEQHLAETSVRIPVGTRDDWDWPSR
jgi:hypothetical protein